MSSLTEAKIKVPHRSADYLGYHNLFTMPFGSLVPCLCQPLIPNTKVHLTTMATASLPPLAADTFLRTKLKLEAFFVPYRILYGGFEKWLTRDVVYNGNNKLGVRIPMIEMNGTQLKTTLQITHNLLDYLGFRIPPSEMDYIVAATKYRINCFPFIAYHKIYDDWYRNTLVQKPVFVTPSAGHSIGWANLPYVHIDGTSATDYSPTYMSGAFNDASSLFGLRQRNFPIDYFTASTPSPQLGDAQSVTVDSNSDGSASVSIASLRAANSLQLYLERNNLVGFRLSDYVRGHYGAHLTNGNDGRPLFLGAGDVEFFSRGIDQTATAEQSNNPFNSVGARYGNASSDGKINLVNDFTTSEPGLLMVLCSAVPKVTYSSGRLRYLDHFTTDGAQTDIADPLLQNVGNQEIRQSELFGSASSYDSNGEQLNNGIFGYQERYAEYKFREDELHGLYCDGRSLQSFAAQRSVGTSPKISTSFLQIPTNYLDQVTAVTGEISQYGVQVDMYHDFSISQPLYESSIPSLIDPAQIDGKTISVQRGGTRLV